MKRKKVEIPKTINSETFRKKYAARVNTMGKVKKQPSELEEQTALIKWVKATYPNALFTVDLGGLNLSKTQRIVHTQRAKRGHPDLMFQEWFKDTYCGLAIEFKRTGVKVEKLCETDAHFKEQLSYLFDLRQRCWCAVFVAGVENAKRVISAYMEANDKSIEIINKHGYPKI